MGTRSAESDREHEQHKLEQAGSEASEREELHGKSIAAGRCVGASAEG